jgi:hypothetical protein
MPFAALLLSGAGLTLCAKKQMGLSQVGPWLHREVLKRSASKQAAARHRQEGAELTATAHRVAQLLPAVHCELCVLVC